MLSRIFVISAIVFTFFLDLAHEGFLQRTCCHEIYELEQDIGLARELLSIEEVGFQSEVFAVLSPCADLPVTEGPAPVSQGAQRTASLRATPPSIAAAQQSHEGSHEEEVPGS